MPVHACIVGSLGILGKGVRRHGENRHRSHIGLYRPADGARGLVSVHHGHHHVRQNSVEAAGGPVDEGLATVRGARDRHALIGKQRRRDLEVEVVIFREQHPHSRNIAACARPLESASKHADALSHMMMSASGYRDLKSDSETIEFGWTRMLESALPRSSPL